MSKMHLLLEDIFLMLHSSDGHNFVSITETT